VLNNILRPCCYTVLCCRYFNDFLRSDFHCKHQIDVLTSGNVVLTDILYNETALFYFMEVYISNIA
jgi:A-kinase anchor protein 10